MARHLFVLLLAAVCLVQMSCGSPLAAEEAYRVLTVERQFLQEAADILARWRRSAADRPLLVGELRALAARRDRLLDATAAKLNWTAGELPYLTNRSAGARQAEPLPQEAERPQRHGVEGEAASQRPTTTDWPGWSDGAGASAEAAATGEVVDLLHQEAPSAEELHRLADEFRRIWRQHQRRFDRLHTETTDEN